MILTPKHLLERICNILDADIEAILSRNKKKELILVRFLFCYIAVKDLNFTNATIGFLLGGDHSKVINAVNRIEQRIDKDDSIVCNAILKIRHELGIYNHESSSTILEKQYDALYLELLKVKKENQELKEAAKLDAAKINKLTIKCLSRPF